MKTETIENIFNFLKEKEGKELPEAWFYVMENFDLIKELENHRDGTQYKYDGYLDLSDTNITKLPNDLFVDGNLYLNRCQYLIELPNELYVEGDLFLNETNITKLPNNLFVVGDLNLHGANITELPNNLYVGVNMYINNTPLAKKYTNEEIRDMLDFINLTIIGKIIRQ